MESKFRQSIKQHIVKSIVLILMIGVLIFLSAGDWAWLGGWLYFGLVILNFLIASIILIPRRPDLLARRSQAGVGTQSWDRYLAPIVGWAPLYIVLISGLAYRFTGEMDISIWIRILAGLMVIVSNLLTTWTMLHNPYFEPTVRIQEEEGHQVAKGGPYEWVRHPGYLSSLLLNLPTPLIFGVLWGYLGVAILVVALVIRTAKEDRFLMENLAGYQDYAEETPYRLIPGVW